MIFKKKKTSGGGRRIRSANFQITKRAPYHYATGANNVIARYKICIYIQYGVLDYTTFDLCNPAIPIFIKKTFSNAQ